MAIYLRFRRVYTCLRFAALSRRPALLYLKTDSSVPFRSRRFSPSPLINLSFRLLAAFQKIDNCIVFRIFLYASGCSVEIIVSFRLFCIRIRIRLLSQLLLRSSPRPISIGQLHALLRFHLRPINLVVFKGSYYLTIWDILS